MNGFRTKVAMLAAAASLVMPAASAAGVLVVRSAGPSAPAYPPGKSLPDGANVSLKPGDILTILGGSSARTLRGPGTFPAAVTARSASGLASAANRRSRFGAMRSGELPEPPSPWHIDVSQSGRMCIADHDKIMLWRPDSAEAATISIASKNAGQQKMDWSAGQATLAWPAQLPVVEGSDYQLSWTGNPDSSHLSFATIAVPSGDLMAMARALIEKGCQSQLDLLIDGSKADAD